MENALWDWLCFWSLCIWGGIVFCFWTFGIVDALCIVVVAALAFAPEKHRQKWKKVEGPMRKWAFGIIVGTSLFSIFFVAPFQFYKKSQETVHSLEQQTNEDAIQIRAFNTIHFDSAAVNAVYEFNKGNYTNCCVYSEKFYASALRDNRDLTLKPLYFCAMLKTNICINGIYSPEALGQFENSLNEMTNDINRAVNERLPALGAQAANIDQTVYNVRLILLRVPLSETNFVHNVICTLTNLQARAEQ